jgi:hypothetical protein
VVKALLADAGRRQVHIAVADAAEAHGFEVL